MLVQHDTQLQQLLKDVRQAHTVVFDTEATGLHLRHDDTVCGISLYLPDTDSSYYLAWGHGAKPLQTDYEALKNWTAPKKAAYANFTYAKHLRPAVLAENCNPAWVNELKTVWTPEKRYIGHNIQFDLTALDVLGFPHVTDIADTMAMLSVVNSDWIGNQREGYCPLFTMLDGTQEKGSRGLKWQARLWGLDDATAGQDGLDTAVQQMLQDIQRYGGERAVLAGKKETASQDLLWMLKPSAVAHYAEEDVRLTWRLYNKLLAWSDAWGDAHLHDLYNRITGIVWEMHRTGFRIDRARGQLILEQGRIEYDSICAEIAQMTNDTVTSPNSPKQIIEYLNSIGHAVASSAKGVLKKIDGVPVLHKIETARRINKLLSTYVQSWLDNAVHDHVHPELNVGGTSTGRLSSSSDMFGNFQNIPRNSAKGSINPKMLLFPPPGNIIIDLDYQALEMRLAAWIAETLIGKGQSLVLTALIERGADMHAYTMDASGIYAMLLAGRTEAQYLADAGHDLNKIDNPVDYFRDKIARFLSKTTNFAAIYGAGVSGIQKAVDCTREQAEVLLSGYHKAYPAVRPAMQHMQRLALQPRDLPNAPGQKGQYIRYPLPGLDLRRKYHWYPVRQEAPYGGFFSPQDKAVRGAFNSAVQGTGGLLVLNSILRIKEKYGFATYHTYPDGERGYDYSTGLVVPHLTVHDSFVLSLRPDDLWIVPGILDLMTDYPTHPKLAVDVSAAPPGGAWGETKSVKDLNLWIQSNGAKGF